MDYLYGKLNGAPTINEIAKDIDNIKSDITELQESYEELNNSLNSKLGKDDLIAGTNIEITDEEGKKVISCTAEGAVYTGGNGINISDENIISIDTEILEPYVTQTELNLQLDDYALKTEIPDVPVQDVTVDGTSVLNDGVAAIILPTVPITGIEVNGTTISPTEGVINITVPTIPANVSAFNNDAGYITNSALTPYVQASSLATVATSGDYNDLINKPTIPVTDVQVDGSSVLDGTIAKITMPTFTQQQADWNQTDDTAVDFIKNKPNLNVYVNKNTDLVKDLTYDKIEKEIPGEIVDGETYELPMEYDMSKFDLPSEYDPPLVLYGDLEHIPFILIYYQGIGYNDDENGYSYMDIGDGYHWYIMGEEPVLYEGEPLSITIDESRINEDEKDILSIILGIQPTIVTVNQTVEDKINEELKDKTYDYVASNIPVNGHTYKLKENANINSLLSDEGSFVTLVLYGNESYRIEYIKSSSKGGSTEYKLNVYNSNDEIIDIYTIAVGAGGEHYVNQWENGTEVLTLDFLYNEQTVNPLYKDYFNQFLNVQESSSRSLKQKFDEVENEINAPLKDKLYEKGEKYYQPLFTPSAQTLDLIWDAGGSPSNPHLVYEDNNLIIETYINSFSFEVFQYYRFTIGNDIYLGSTDFSGYWQHTDADSNVEQINSQEDLPKITFNKQYITPGDEELFNGLIYSKDSNITLEQKFNEIESPLKDKTYEEIKGELVNGEDYTLPVSYSDDFFTTYEDLFTTGSGTSIYSTGLGVEIDLVKINLDTDLNILFILFNNADMNICVAYVKMPEGIIGVNDGWYEAEWDNELDGWNLVNPPTTASNPTLLQYEDTFVIQNYEEVLKAVLGLGIIKISLEEKINSLEVVAFNAIITTDIWETTENQTIANYYNYQAVIQNDDLINSVKCDVEFDLTDMLSENYAPYYECNNETGELTIYAKEIPQSSITIKIVRWLGKTIINS